MKRQIKQNIFLSWVTLVLLTTVIVLYIADLYIPTKFVGVSVLVILDLAILNGIIKDTKEVNGR